jgi:hypothetical protein
VDWLNLVAGASKQGSPTQYLCKKALENDYGSGYVQRQVQKDLGQITKAAMSENQGLTGGYLLPPSYTNQLLRCIAEESFIFPRAKVIPMPGETCLAPRIKVEAAPTAAGQNPMLGGITFAWGKEITPTETADPTFAMDNFTAWDLIGYCVVSNQWLHDSSQKWGAPDSARSVQANAGNGYGMYNVSPGDTGHPDPNSNAPRGATGNATWNPGGQPEPRTPQGRQVTGDPLETAEKYLFDLFATGATWYAEWAFLNGSGSAQQMPLGILNSPARIDVTRQTTGVHITSQDIPGMTSSLLTSSWKNAIWACSPTALNQIQQITQYFFNIELTHDGAYKLAPKPCGMLSTLPLFVTDKLPTCGNRGDLILFDPSRYVITQRQEVLVEVSSDDALRTNQSTIRIWYRLDGKPELAGSVTTQDTTTKVSPYVVLK